MNEIRIDVTELEQLADDLGRIPMSVVKESRPILKKGATELKKKYRQQATGHPYFRHLPRTIDYTGTVTATGIRYEVGVNKSKYSGPLGNIFFFGVPRTAAIGDLMGPLEEEAGALEKHLGDMATRILES